MASIQNDWLSVVSPEFRKPYYKELYEFICREYQEHTVYPPAQDIFNAFHYTPLSEVKVVILGQDPYHNIGQAHGLSFSVQVGQEIPPSLVNIYKELQDEAELDKIEAEMSQYKMQDEDVLSYALFPQVAVDFFKYREAQKEKIDPNAADTKNNAYPV